MHAAARMILQHRAPDGSPAAIDFVHDNAAWAGALPRISVCVPTFRYDATPLIEALAACSRASEIEIVVLDDGSGDDGLVARLEQAADRVSAPVRVVAASRNRGRSGARNRAMTHARATWVLLLDSDMLPDDADFLARYLDAAAKSPAGLIVGGYSLKQAPLQAKYALHRWQAATSECLSAAERTRDPGRHVFTSNVLVHRDLLASHAFDEAFAGWGWEDVDWGLRIAQDFPVTHIDNTATHLGLDEDAALLSKYTRSAANFALLSRRHPAAMQRTPLWRAAHAMKGLPCRPALAALAKKIVLRQELPASLRGRALKLARAIKYAEAL